MSRRQAWHEVATDLVDVAMGRKTADLLIHNGRWVNVHSGEILPGTDIAVSGSRIAFVGEDAAHTVGPDTKIVEAHGRYLVPGLCDAHMHIESSMVTVTEFARAVIPQGTTSMFIDSHDIVNVLGLPGIRLLHDESATLPVNIYVLMASFEPSASGLETTGASISPEEVAEAMTWPGIIDLGGMMNFRDVPMGDETIQAELAETMKAGKVIGGHYASPDLGLPFHGYLAEDPAVDHEGIRAEDAIAWVRQGMKVMLCPGSAWHEVNTQVKAITEEGLDSRNFILCTDESHSGTHVHDGHMNSVVRNAIAQGVRPVTAIQMATLNTAEHFGLEKDLGSITPGRYADIIISSDLTELPVEMVISAGEIIAENGSLTIELPPYDYPEFAKETIKLGKRIQAVDFDIWAPAGRESVKVRAIGVIENQATTRSLERELAVHNGLVKTDIIQDVCQIALVERHRATGEIINGFVSGFGFDVPCAVASSVAHDSHHMIVAGTSKEDMARAANRLSEVGGGIAVYNNGQEIALIELPIAGLMSDERAEKVAAKADRMVQAFRECGSMLDNAYTQFSLLSLVAIPELRISDLGIVDVTEFEVVPIFVY